MFISLSNVLAFAPIDPTAADDATFGGLVLYVLLALGFSFLCSVWEAVILSSSLSQVELAVSEGKRSGLLMQKHKQNVEKPISAILTLNTIAHTVGAAGAGAQAAVVFSSVPLGVISGVLTLLILVFSEIIPKTLGAVYWRQLMPFTAYSVQFLIWILYPAVWAFQVMTRYLKREDEEPTVTRSEIEVMAQISTQEGGLQEREGNILKNLFQLSKVQISEIMTPRTVVLALQQDLTVGAVIKHNRVLPYSRIPIYNENTDDIVAFVLRYRILKEAAEDSMQVTLKDISLPIHAVPETNTIARVLEEFTTRKDHIFLVFDEFGGTSGIITMEDALETLLGVEITDESDLVVDLREMAQQRYQRQRDLLEQVTRLDTTELPSPSAVRESVDTETPELEE